MGMRIFLRTDGATSHFRRNLLRLIESPGKGELLLCSGYICEGPTYAYSILNDELLNAIVRGCNRVDCVGVMPSATGSYRSFVNTLRRSVLVRPFYAPRWHAKIAIKSLNNHPLAGLIGSSNLTRKAYLEPCPDYNHEADVLIWINSREYENHFMAETEPTDDPLSPIEAVLRGTSQPQEEDRLKALYDLIMQSVHPLDI